VNAQRAFKPLDRTLVSLTAKKAALELGVSEKTVRRLWARGELGYYPVGRAKRTTAEEVTDFKRRNWQSGRSGTDSPLSLRSGGIVFSDGSQPARRKPRLKHLKLVCDTNS